MNTFTTSSLPVATYLAAGQDRARWLAKTEAIEVSETELNDDTRHRLSSYEVIDVSR